MRMNSLAAECLASGWKTQFCGDIPDRFVLDLLSQGHGHTSKGSRKVSCVEEGMFKSLRTCGNRPWVVLDGYGFGIDYQRRLLDYGVLLMFMDDCCHLSSYLADLIVNQNMGSESYHYNASRGGACKLGPEYALLRKDFSRWVGWMRQHPNTAQRVLVTAGGSDSGGHLLAWLVALEKIHSWTLDIHVITGEGNSQQYCFEAFARNSRHNIEVTSFSNDMSGLMAWADIAITAGGSTLLEMAFMSLPSISISLAVNQIKGAYSLALAGGTIYLGEDTKLSSDLLAKEIDRLIQDRKKRESMGFVGRKLVDGRGAERLRLAMEDMR